MIAAAPAALYAVLAATAALLLWIAVRDLRSFSISNNAVLLLAALFGLYTFISRDWMGALWHLAFAASMFALLLICYARGLMGGGDVKLLTVAFLWTGAHCAIVFLLVMLAAAMIHTLLAKLDYVRSQRVNGRLKLAFGPSICAGLIGLFASGCLLPK